MSYRLWCFDGVVLPLYNPEAGPAAFGSHEAFIPTVGGHLFDGYGAAVSHGVAGELNHSGVYSGAEIAATRAMYDAIAGKLHHRATLIRRALGTTEEHAIDARLTGLSAPTYEVGIGGCVVKLSLKFQALDSVWSGAAHDITAGVNPVETAFDGDLPIMLVENVTEVGSGNVTLPNDGNAAQNHITATITIGTAATILVGIRNYTTGHWLVAYDYDSQFQPNERVVFDTRANTIYVTDSGGGFLRSVFGGFYNLGATNEWFALAPGDNAVEVGFGSGTSGTGYSARFEYADGWH